jgi:hypothetical protein
VGRYPVGRYPEKRPHWDDWHAGPRKIQVTNVAPAKATLVGRYRALSGAIAKAALVGRYLVRRREAAALAHWPSADPGHQRCARKGNLGGALSARAL